MITREDVGRKIEGYLHHRDSLEELVDWAEEAMLEAEFEEANFEAIRDAVARLGVADVRAFGLTWEECEELLERLGYRVKIEVTKVG